MTIDIALLRKAVGLDPEDASADSSIEAAFALALTLAERYCDRLFLFQRQTERFVIPHIRRFFITRYPIRTVHSISADGGTGTLSESAYAVHYDLGEIIVNACASKYVTIDYEGGYKTLPADLQWAIVTVYKDVFAEMFPDIGAGGGGGSTVIEGSGDVKQVTLFGVGAVSYDVGTTVANASASGADSDAGRIMIDPTSRLSWVLDSYRRMCC